MAGVRPAPLRPGRPRDRAALRREPAPPATGWQGEPWPAAMDVHGRASPRSCTGRLAGEPDPDVAGLAVDGAGRRRLARGRAADVHAHLLDGSAGGEPAGLAVDDGHGQRQALRVQPLAGGEAGARPAAARCPLATGCPIQDWPDAAAGPAGRRPRPAARPRSRPDRRRPERRGTPSRSWLTAESLGDEDPALAADPDRPAVFVFDAPLLRRLRLSGKRLVFLAETLGDLAARRPVEVRRGDAGRGAGGPVARRDLRRRCPGWPSGGAPGVAAPVALAAPSRRWSVASFTAWVRNHERKTR